MEEASQRRAAAVQREPFPGNGGIGESKPWPPGSTEMAADRGTWRQQGIDLIITIPLGLSEIHGKRTWQKTRITFGGWEVGAIVHLFFKRECVLNLSTK